MKDKVKVGQELYIVSTNYRKKTTRKAVVEKVGRKFFYLRSPGFHHEDRFHIDSWRHDNGAYSPDWDVYESEQEYQNFEEGKRLISEIHSITRFQYTGNASLEDIKKAHELLNQ